MTAPALRFDLEWRTTVFTLVLLPIMVGLGFWQLQRADEKRELAAAFAARQQQPPAPLASLRNVPASELAYRPVTVTGEFDSERYLLLDNRVNQGRFGYEVIALLWLDNQHAVLVNRGWVAGDAARRSLPDVNQPNGVQRVNGSVYVAPDEPYLLGEQHVAGDWPIVIQALEAEGLVAALAERLGADVYPWSVRIEATEPAALVAQWPVVNASPAKHTGYAVQWFCMALALSILFLLRSSNLWQWLRRRETTEN